MLHLLSFFKPVNNGPRSSISFPVPQNVSQCMHAVFEVIMCEKDVSYTLSTSPSCARRVFCTVTSSSSDGSSPLVFCMSAESFESLLKPVRPEEDYLKRINIIFTTVLLNVIQYFLFI